MYRRIPFGVRLFSYADFSVGFAIYPIATPWRVSAVKQGSSDSGISRYVATKLLTWPVTYVYAKSNSPEDILDAIVKGRTTICFSAKTTFIDITSGDSVMGDTVRLTQDTTVTINVKNFRKNTSLLFLIKTVMFYLHSKENRGLFRYSACLPRGFYMCSCSFWAGFFIQ